MTTFSAKILADSLSPAGKRLTTMELRYPRFIHPEFMTHRVFSRNASSSRAIPVERLIEDVRRDPAMPIHWGKNQPGMQAREEHSEPVKFRNDSVPPDLAWLRARDTAVQAAKQFAKAGYHKQIVNRLLEPFVHINVVVTATEWDNFFELRCHKDAQPEIQKLASEMLQAMNESEPVRLGHQGWHLPYIEEEDERDPRLLALVSAARCARVSYRTHDGRPPDWQEDMKLARRLLDSRHMSPFEHQARPALWPDSRSGNFIGWEQHRQII